MALYPGINPMRQQMRYDNTPGGSLSNIGYQVDNEDTSLSDNASDPYGLGGRLTGRLYPQSTPPAPNPADFGDTPVSIPTGEHPTNPYNWWNDPANAGKSTVTMADGTVYNFNAIPNGRQFAPTRSGMNAWLNPRTNQMQWGGGNGWHLNPAGSPTAFSRSTPMSFLGSLLSNGRNGRSWRFPMVGYR